MQYFKGDDTEKKYEASASGILDSLSAALNDFLAGAYDAGPLGDLLHDIKRSPLANAIKLEIFRTCFNTIYTAFTVSGSFESYLTVFSKIFGDDVAVTFTVPAEGHLQIGIVASHLVEDDLVARDIIVEHYSYDNIIWYDTTPASGNILVQSVKGFRTQYELEQMLFEMVPAGIFTEITLTFA